MKKKVVYFGYLAKGLLPFLVQLKKELENNDCEFLLFFISINANDLNNSELDNLEYINFDHFHFYPYEDFFNIIKADFYILWGGYDGVLAHYRNYLLQKNIPHLLCEYTGIKNLFHFDTALNGESTFVRHPLLVESDNISYELLLRDRIETLDVNSVKLLDFKKNYNKVVSYFGMWDWAAGLNDVNSIDIQKQISECYTSSYEALIDLHKNLPKNTLLIIKPHPHDSSENKQLFQEFSKNNNSVLYIDSDFNASEVINISDVVCTIASTININAVYAKKPLVLLAKTYLSVTKYSYTIDKYLSLSECLNAALNNEDWKNKLQERNNFFVNFLLNANVFSVDFDLNTFGVKNTSHLSQLIMSRVQKVYSTKIFTQPYLKMIQRLLYELSSINETLINRTKRLEVSEKELIDRTQRLEIAEKELIDQTQRLEIAEKELIDQTQRLEIAEKELIDRTQRLEIAEKELIDQTQRLEIAEINLDKYQKSSFVFRGKIIF
ncbi:hypothetical protein N5T67_00665 [Aliarcobacter butzleri]|uniref:capsular polysaccharide export protein, LipB/KpsS family n=1 Tax=Aliarcobacter butzleri TaxID=28197 RepID=UPI0021B35809|nr:hypothetical protein [Aliarcobacter butzleri]MCT7551337.1 hypothetical protein [Aliarcobacter butzleri]